MLLAVRDAVADVRYWHHPESGCVGECTAKELEDAFRSDDCVEEINGEQYLRWKVYYNAIAQGQLPDIPF